MGTLRTELEAILKESHDNHWPAGTLVREVAAHVLQRQLCRCVEESGRWQVSGHKCNRCRALADLDEPQGGK